MRKYQFIFYLWVFCFGALAKAAELDYQLIEKNGQEIHLVYVDLSNYKIISVRAGNEHAKEAVSTLTKKFDASIGINGGFFYFMQDGKARPAGILKIDNQWLNYTKLPKDAIGWNNDNHEVLVDKILVKKNLENKIEVLPQFDASPSAKTLWQQFPYIVGGIPLLIKNGKAMTHFGKEKILKSFVEQRHARTAICVKDKNHWILLVAAHTKEADRPHVNKVVEGLTLVELTQFLRGLGCRQAINLDGGGSSTMVIDNKIMNSSAGDMDDILHFYHERPVSDAILVVKR